ncbi:TetR/AcrR family transcriptional regulator C-terminal domain-containing protein [Bombilactobacillus thymidiniphilus]|uniref:TetR/AcrR family transcriptional regulator C-terminal domain-containing protein n=1 Tax=Bombilactobacillus thymidiniphilus TaxID=2923363 RepID=A0ABY4PEY8_9LACO|nr:TetR/AcrR family transcriptional regulator C-terminal domain-containing protein [Bombilactobacillus thymidiniphilus]UQS84135.1 TetR/AcrR family transcriptional regulator C-terminal domain-containing protein [Bombilactobacillus thymidiniphilus]
MNKIATKLQISRQALYQSHFHNINELLNVLHFYIDQDIKKSIKKIISNNTYNSSEFVVQLSQKIVPMLYEKRLFLYILYCKEADPSWISFIEKQYSSILEPILRQKQIHKNIQISTSMQSKVIIHQFLGIISAWMSTDSPECPESFAPKFEYLLRHSII